MTLREQAHAIIEKIQELVPTLVFTSTKQKKYHDTFLKDFCETHVPSQLESAENMSDDFTDIFDMISGVDADYKDSSQTEWTLETALELIELVYISASDAIAFLKNEWVY